MGKALLRIEGAVLSARVMIIGRMEAIVDRVGGMLVEVVMCQQKLGATL